MSECKHVWKQTEVAGTTCVHCGVKYLRPFLHDWERIKELEASVKWYETSVEAGGGYFGSLAEANKKLRGAAQAAVDKAEDICNKYSALDLHVLDIDMVWDLIKLCNNDSELAAALEDKDNG